MYPFDQITIHVLTYSMYSDRQDWAKDLDSMYIDRQN